MKEFVISEVKAETLTELNNKEITKQTQRDLFLFTKQLH